MKLTRHNHACVTIEHDGTTIVIDPGTLTPNAAELLHQADAVLVTHDHFDHFDRDAIRAALAQRPELRIYGTQAVVDALTDTDAASDGQATALTDTDAASDGQATAITEDTEFTVGPISVSAFAGLHGVIHPEIGVHENVTFLVGGAVLHPGDSYSAPGVPVDTLLLPTSGPWTVMAQAIDFVREVGPRQSIPIHDAMLSDVGKKGADRMLGEGSLTAVPMLPLQPGESVEL